MSKVKIVRNKKGESKEEALERVRTDDIREEPGTKLKFEDPDTPPKAVEKKDGMAEMSEKVMNEMKQEAEKKEGNALQVAVDSAKDSDGLKAEAEDKIIETKKGGMVDSVPEGTIIDKPVSTVFTVPDMPIDFVPVNSFVSMLVPEVTPLLSRVRLLLNMEIGDISTRAKQTKALWDLSMQVMETYDGVRVGLDREIRPLFADAKVTMESQAGFNFRSLMNALNGGDYATWLSEYRTVPAVDKFIRQSSIVVRNPKFLTEEVVERHNYYGLLEEFELMKEYHRINQEKLFELRDIREMFEVMAGPYHYLGGVQPEFTARFEKVFIDKRFVAYNEIVLNNDFIHLEMYDVIKNEVMRNMMMDIEKTDTAISKLSIAARQRRGQSTKFTEVPGAMSGQKAMDSLIALATTALMNEVVRIETRFPVDDFSPVLVIEALLWKLMVPGIYTNRITELSVNNYLSEWFVRFLPGVTNNQYSSWDRVPRPERQNPENDYLFINRDRIPDWAQPFLLAKYWNMGDRFNTVAVDFPTGVAECLGRRTHYYPWGGEEPGDWTFMWTQLDRFIRFVDDMESKNRNNQNKGKIPGDTSGNDYDALVRTLREVKAMAFRLTDFSYYFNRALRQMSVTPIALLSDENFKEDVKHARISIPQGGLFSLIMLGDAETIRVNNFGLDFYRFGRNMNRAFNILTENYYFSVDSMPRTKDEPFFSKTEILDNALRMTPSSGINDLMKKTFGVKPNSHDVVWPDRTTFGYDTSVFKRKIDLAKSFVDSQSKLFNYAKCFFYAPGRKRSERYDGIFKEYFLLPKSEADNPDITLEWTDIILLFQNDEMATLLRDARRKRRIIKFNVPIKTDFVHGDPITNEQLAPMNFKKDTLQPIKMDTLKIFFRDEEEFLKRDLNTNATLEDPDWVVSEEEVPRILNVDQLPRLLIHNDFITHVEGYKVVDEIDEMTFVARNI